VKRLRWLIAGLIGVLITVTIVVLTIQPATKEMGAFGMPPGEQIRGLKNPEKLILYSIHGTEDIEANREARLAAGEEDFAGYSVLGKLELINQSERTKLVSALQDAIIHHDGMASKCFRPRHAILAVETGTTFEIVICFQCRQYMLNGRGFPLISKRPEAKFNDYLKKAGIPIVP
jgi:hypothetical protein